MKKTTRTINISLKSILFFSLFFFSFSFSEAQYTTLHSFKNSGGAYPYGSFIRSGNKLYGMTLSGGATGAGNVFSVNLDGSGYNDLLDFSLDTNNGFAPSGSLVLSGSKLFGMTWDGGINGLGNIFTIDTNGNNFKELHDFDDVTGGGPVADLTISGNVLYGMTYRGGVADSGVIFSIDTNGAGYTELFDFTGEKGSAPAGSLTLSGTKLYGMTQYGGAYNYGVIFSINTNGTGFSKLLDFDGSNGSQPYGSLILSGTTLYGMSVVGGSIGYGNVFSINTNGTGFFEIHGFNGTDGSEPWGSLTLSGGVLYGITTIGGVNGVGNVFSVNTNGTGFNDMHDFNYSDGAYPAYNCLTLAAGVLYGMTPYGGADSLGNVFSIKTNGTNFTNVYNFNGGAPNRWYPNSHCNLARSGNTLYGTMNYGGAYGRGYIFSSDTNGNSFTDLFDFDYSYGSHPNAGVVISGTTLYGMTPEGGANGLGDIYSLNTVGSVFTDLLDFSGTNGANPLGDLTISGTTLYGMTARGGAHDSGSIFQIQTDGSGYQDLHDFDFTNGSHPYGDLTLSGTTLYGMTGVGGANWAGVIFSISTSGTGFTKLHDFSYATGESPFGSLTLSGITLYGMANAGGSLGYGSVFSINTNGSGYADIHDFNSFDGNYVYGSLTLTNGLLYGMTSGAGNSSYAYGNLFSIHTNGTGIKNLHYFDTLTGIYPVNSLIASGNVLYGMTTQGGAYGVNGNGVMFRYRDAPLCTLIAVASATANVSCYGGSNGIVTAIPSAGTSPYTYLWSGATSATTASVSNLSAGSYTVTVSDATGSCSASASVTITQPVRFIYITAGTISNITCNGSNNGRATVNSVGGNTPYTYAWSNGASTVSTSQTPNTLSAGNYTVTVTDNCGASHTSTVSITQPNPLRDSIVTQTNIVCGGGNGGSATIGAKGGSYPYNYVWSNGNTLATASNLTAGTYSVVITDHNGCTNTINPVIITQPTHIRDSVVSVTYPACNGLTGSASVGITGGVAPYLYSWSPNVSTTSSAANMAAATYTVTMKDAHRCSVQLVIALTQPLSIHDTIVRSLTVNNICKSGTAGSATVGVKYGTQPYAYNWFPNSCSTATASGLSAGTYSVFITDNNGCSSSFASVTITEPASYLHDSAAWQTNVGCYGGSGGQVSLGSRGGVSPYTYAWNDGKTTSLVTGLTVGTYSVVMTDNLGCSLNTTGITITQPSAAVSSSIPTPTCGPAGHGTITISASGGTPGYVFVWSNGNTTTSMLVTNNTYTVKVTDSHGCSATNTVTMACPDALPGVKGDDTPEQTPPPACCETLDNITLYPNPNNGQFTITVESEKLKVESNTVEIYNMLGQKVCTQLLITNYSSLINISDQPNGIYLIRILDNNGNLVSQKKVVKTN